jgi:hypothetical protein
MDCCNFEKINDDFKCPVCASVGAKVENITITSHLIEEYIPLLDNRASYKFCKNPKCKVVYFYANKKQIFKIKNIKSKVTLKDPALDVAVCYCFNYTRLSILDEIRLTGESSCLSVVMTKIQNKECFCKLSNPQGDCCIVNMKKWIADAKQISLL